VDSHGETTPTVRRSGGSGVTTVEAGADAHTHAGVVTADRDDPRRTDAGERSSAWKDLDAIIPLRPRPVRLTHWATAERPAAATALALLALIAGLMLRPLSWAGLGGEQTMPGVAVFPRSYLVFVPVAMAICAWLLTRLLIGMRHRARLLGIAGLAVFAIDAGARVHLELRLSWVTVRCPLKQSKPSTALRSLGSWLSCPR
jgi:hypothetical protein